MWLVLVLLTVLVCPNMASAQSALSGTGAVAGAVRDTTGAAIPGVTVEASSPALIEKVRVAVTDGQGNFRIVDLRPGLYTVVFTLPGFTSLRRQGIELASGVTTTVNAELTLSQVEETVTVSGASPVVDVQNVQAVSILSRQAQDALPVAKTMSSYSALTLGAILTNPADQDVGGSRGDGASGGFDPRLEAGGREGDNRRYALQPAQF